MTLRVVRHKFHARPTFADGIRFASNREANYYRGLLLAQRSGELLFFLRQVPLHLPGSVKYVCDFLEFWKDGSARFVDVKGHKTREYKTKKRLVEATYPITITES